MSADPSLTQRAEELIQELNSEAECIEYTPVQSGVNEYSGEPLGPEPQGPTQESDRFRRSAQVIADLLSENRQIQAENEKLKDYRNVFGLKELADTHLLRRCEQMAEQVDRISAEREAYREALKPIAEAARGWDSVPDERAAETYVASVQSNTRRFPEVRLSVAHLREARRILAENDR